MTFLPIVERELRVAARLTATYRNRTLTAAAVAAVAVVMLLVGTFSPFPSQIGPYMFSTLSWLTLIFCVFEGVRKTADCISGERREGTLGLLFLTDLKGYDVVLGKLAGTSLTSLYGLVGMLPILALSLLLGGVTQGEFWRMALALINVLFFSLCVGVWVSSHSRVERNATTGALLFILLWLIVPLVVQVDALLPWSPAYAFHAAPDVLFRTRAAGYWQSLALSQVMSWLLLAWASLAVTRIRLEKELAPARFLKSERWRHWRFGNAATRAKVRAELLRINPALWLAARNLGHRFTLWILLAAVVCGGVLISAAADSEPVGALVAFFYLVNLVVKMRFAVMACHCLAEARANNALEMLLCTPLKVEEMIAGQVLALKRVFLLPVTLILVAEVLVLFVTALLLDMRPAPGSGSGNKGMLGGIVVMIGISGIIGVSLYVMDMMAVMWAGMWFGLSAKNETQATFKTIFYVLLLPYLFVLFGCFGFPMVLAIPVIAIAVGRQKLHAEFRKLAAQRFDAGAATSGWWFNRRTKQVRLS